MDFCKPLFWRKAFDVAERGIASINPKGSCWTTVYDLANQSIDSGDPLGRRSKSVYNNVELSRL